MIKKIAWIGTGVMGKPMALHLAKTGYEVSVFNRTFSKAKALEPQVKAFDTIKDAVVNADVIFTIVGYPADVKMVMQSVFKYAKKEAIVIDMTTSSPKLAQILYKEAKKYQVSMLDAPVTGGETGAIDASLSIMVGGDRHIYDEVMPLLSVLGKTITYMGKAGSGQYAKLSNQAAIAGTLAGVTEALVFAMDNDLDLNNVLKVINGGSASSWQAQSSGLKMVQKDYQPGFYIKHFLKDLNLILEATQKELSVVTKVRDMLEKLTKEGFSNLGTQALILYYLDDEIKSKEKA